MGKMVLAIAAAFAEFEKDIIRQRTLDGLARARSQGKRLGRPPGSKDRRRRKKRGTFYGVSADVGKWVSRQNF